MAKNIAAHQSPFDPLPGFIVVTPLEEKTISGNSGVSFTISDSQKDKDLAGVVVAVGEALTEVINGNIITTPKPEVKVGDKIVHSTYYAAPYLHQGKYYRFIAFRDLRSKIK